MKKITPVEIFVIFIVLAGFAFYVLPKIMLSFEQKAFSRMQTNAAMMTSKILAEFSENGSKKKPGQISKELAREMNKQVKNPVNRKNPAYSIDEECQGCIVISPDDQVKTIVLTGKDSKGGLILRTVIQPPSFVTYSKDFNEK